ncbi:hypothetical protein [Ilumatobacter coccineus]|uniref:hypothetical protein n=1 Tax=Ilumatobacter coccineus TaxID=467094 RepID=UPI00059BAE0C|nr:hypothetical protein [Ilumatobacter coccineus]
MAFVNKQGGAEKHETQAGAGLDIDFDPSDPATVKVHYDLSAWTFDQRAELSEALADADLPHAWDGEELLVPESVEDATDAMFDKLEAEIGPFPIGLDDDAESTEFNLDEWTDADRKVLTESLVESEIPHRWTGATVIVAQDAEDAVDDLLDAIESGELMSADPSSEASAPDGVLSDVFLAANKLAKDPFDAKSRTLLIDLNEQIDPKHPPYAFAPRTWSQVVDGVGKIVDRIMADASGDRVDDDGSDRLDESSDVIGLAQSLRELVRPFV